MSTSKPEFNEDLNLKSSSDDSVATTAASLFLNEIRSGDLNRSVTASEDRMQATSGSSRNPEMMQVASIRDYLPTWLGGTTEKESTPAGNLPAEAPLKSKGKEHSLPNKDAKPGADASGALPDVTITNKAKDSAQKPVFEKTPQEIEKDRRAAVMKPLHDVYSTLKPFTPENTDAQLAKIQDVITAREPQHQTAADRELAVTARVSLATDALRNNKPELARQTLTETMNKYPEAATDQHLHRAFASTAGTAGMFKDEKFLAQYEKAGGKRDALYAHYAMSADERKVFDNKIQPMRDVLDTVKKTGTMSDEQRKTMTDFIAACDKTPQSYMDWQAGWSASNKLVQALDSTGDTRGTIGALAEQAKKYPGSLAQEDMLEIAGRNFAGLDPRFRDAYGDAMAINSDRYGTRSDITWNTIERNGFPKKAEQINQYNDAVRLSQFPSDKAPHRDELRVSAIEHTKELIAIHEKTPTDVVSRWTAKEMRLQNIEQMAQQKGSPEDLRGAMLEALTKYPELDKSARYTNQAVKAGLGTDINFMKPYQELTGKAVITVPPRELQPQHFLPDSSPWMMQGGYRPSYNRLNKR